LKYRLLYTSRQITISVARKYNFGMVP
jgi:hypothetical protein